MIKVLEQAIDKVKSLDPDRQAYAASVLEDIASDAVFVIRDEHKAALDEALAQVSRGERASDADMAALWKKCGL
jgi:hypothetical protein